MEQYTFSPEYGYIRMPDDYNKTVGASRYCQNQIEYLSAHFTLISFEGKLIWDNAIKLLDKRPQNPKKYGEILVNKDRIHFFYLEEGGMKVSLIEKGEIVYQNKSVGYPSLEVDGILPEKASTDLGLQGGFDGHFLLSGTQEIKFVNHAGKVDFKELFFF